jgi:predicted Zn-dependent protease
MKDQLDAILTDLRECAREQDITAEFWLHTEHSALMRFANSAVSLNTNEDLLTLTVTAYRGNARGTHTVVTGMDQRDVMRAAITDADELAAHATPVNYDVTIAALPEDDEDDDHIDESLARLTPQEQLAFVNEAVAGIEADDLLLSGMFGSGTIRQAAANTLGDDIIFHAGTDAHVSLVLSHATEKWEIAAEQTTATRAGLDPAPLNAELARLAAIYREAKPFQAQLGTYDVVFGRKAFADLLEMATHVGFTGGASRRQLTFLKAAHIGRKIFSEQLSIHDDPTAEGTFPYLYDMNGVRRRSYPLVEQGVFKGFYWDRDSADEFSEQETGHSVPSDSIVVAPGDADIDTLGDLLDRPRTRDLLYLPHLHYMNVVNRTQGVVTCCSRFGALLLKVDGVVAVPFNVRMTESLLNILANIEWLSKARTTVNTSDYYGYRTPAAKLVPNFVCVRDVEITHANVSF